MRQNHLPHPRRCLLSCVCPRAGKKSLLWLGPRPVGLLTRPQAGNDFKPPVKSHILTMKGAARGVRLVDLQSLLAHLGTLPNVWPGKLEKPARVTAKKAHQGGSSK